MPIIGEHKPLLLQQIQREKPGVQQIKEVLQNYEDLTLNDLRSVISDETYIILLDETRDPQEKALWTECQNYSENQITLDSEENIERSISNITVTLRNLSTYISRYTDSPKIQDANQLYSELLDKKEELEEVKRNFEAIKREKEAWEKLDKNNYAAVLNYLRMYPESAHRNEIDDILWNLTKAQGSSRSFDRYIIDLPTGKHVAEAESALNAFSEWEEVKRSGDLFKVSEYLKNHSDSPFKREIDRLYYDLVDKKMEGMQNNPADYSYEEVTRLINSGIFKDYELIDKGLMTEQSWDILQDRENIKAALPDLKNFVFNSVEGTADGATDVFLFGTPGTGKTCMLMGLVGANGTEFEGGKEMLTYTLNLQQYGGNYAAALQEYIYAGMTPGRTFGSFVTSFHGNIQAHSRGKSIDHPINLVEMSGEEFATKIAENENASLSFENMGSGATRIMSNNNRKIFFIIVDPTVTKIKIQILEDVKDDDGNVIDQRIRNKYIDQRIILSKFVSLFELPENQDIMKRVEAIHFIVTKSDFLDKDGARNEVAANILRTVYQATVTKLKSYCQKSKRINLSTNYSPQVFTFSLGRFYLGDIFAFDPTETQKIINAIRVISRGKKEKSIWDTIKEKLG